MLNAIWDSLSDYAQSDNEENGDHKEDHDIDTEVSELNEDDEPGCVIGSISNTLGYHVESSQKMKVMLDQLTHPGGRDAADHFHEKDKLDGMAELNDLQDVLPQKEQDEAVPVPTASVNLMETLDLVIRKLQMPQGTS
jgi:hypothetical protein